MKFKEMLNQFRERRGLNKSETALRLDVTPTYYMELETGRKSAPTREKLDKLSEIFELSPSEKQLFIDTAMEERLRPDELLWVESKQEIIKGISTEILEALRDPVAVKALLATHKNKKDIKDAIQRVIELLPDMPSEKRKAILALCS